MSTITKEKDKITYLDYIKDTRIECYSVLIKLDIKSYLAFINAAYESQGGIAGQRGALKTKSAQRIRKRMIEDIQKGAVMPPIVLGLTLNEDDFSDFDKDIKDIKKNTIEIFKLGGTSKEISIIDGMQRTTALLEAKKDKHFDETQEIRVELWIAKVVQSLIYRMLVLNSGQIPWTLNRQIEVVFSSFKKELEQKVRGIELIDTDDKQKRKKAGQYLTSEFIEIFINFATRSTKSDLKDEVAQTFARLDVIDITGRKSAAEYFYGVAQLLVDLDNAFCSVEPTTMHNNTELKFKSGKSIFSSQPARVGFVVAVSHKIFGIPGMEKTNEEENKQFQKAKNIVENFVKKLSQKSPEERWNLLSLETLEEIFESKKTISRIGDYDRNLFLKSFNHFLENSEKLDSLEYCWRAGVM